MRVPTLMTICACCLLPGTIGCSTTRTSDTDRTGIEQLLISNAVDQALEKYDFRTLYDKNVYIDDKYLDSVDKGYLLSSLRERILYNGGRIAAKAEDSDITLEVRSGGVGTDNQEIYLGIPNMSVPGLIPIEIPEVKVWNRTSQIGTAKLGILAYETDSGAVYQHGGSALARSDDTKWFLLGVGPFQSGTVMAEVENSTASPSALARALPAPAAPSIAARTDAQVPLASGTSEPHRLYEPAATPGPPTISGPAAMPEQATMHGPATMPEPAAYPASYPNVYR